MTPQKLASAISRLPAIGAVTNRFSLELKKRGIWGLQPLWYTTQKQHWLGWLREYIGPGYYGRKNWNRDAEFVYNHIVCPPMILWLGEASGVPLGLVRKARRAALDAMTSLSARAAAIRMVIPWALIEERLTTSTATGHGRQVASPARPYVLSENCVYAIVERRKLDHDFRAQCSCDYIEGKPWATAAALLKEAQMNKTNLPVVFGNADDCSKLSHWALLEDIEPIDGRKPDILWTDFESLAGITSRKTWFYAIPEGK